MSVIPVPSVTEYEPWADCVGIVIWKSLESTSLTEIWAVGIVPDGVTMVIVEGTKLAGLIAL
jgi:hypothetical protein